MSAARLTLIGIVAFAISLVAFAPASLLKPAFERVPGLAVTDLTGSLWRGSGHALYRGVDLGAIRFTFAPADLLRLRLGFDVAARGPALDVGGHLSAGFAGYALSGAGNADFSLARDFLARYDLRVPGELTISQIAVEGRYGARLPSAEGEVQWSGGDIGYRFGGEARSAVLPPLAGIIDSAKGYPQMTVHARDDSTPLLLTHVEPDGMATVGITKQFTKLVGQTWMSSEPDHAVVLEVAEKVF